MKVDYEVFRKILNSLIKEPHYNKSPDDIFEDVFGHQTDAERLFGYNTPRTIKFWGHMYLLQDLGLLDCEGHYTRSVCGV